MQSLEYRKVPSKSRDNVTHRVVIVDGQTVGCTCESWTNGIKRTQPYVCIHMLDVSISLETVGESNVKSAS